jgi:Zn-dependent peptidase ImmA (M78 family)
MRNIKSVKILGLDYEVCYPNEIKRADGENVTGACVVELGQIYIKADISPPQRELTLWHEILHAITCDVAPKLYQDEDAIAALAMGVWSVVKNNPKWW